MPDAIVKTQDTRAYRLSNIDMLRGLVLVIMVLDHVRDFFLINAIADPMGQADIPASIYLTRWITHLCAPVFVLLAGTSAGLMSTRKSHNDMAEFLFKRGLWLIFIELALLSTIFTMSPLSGVPEFGGRTSFFLQVIWAIGASMVILAGAQYLGRKACLIIGLTIVLGHNSLDTVWPSGELFSGTNPLWYGLYSQSSTFLGPFFFVFTYPLIPWIGVMLLGYGSSTIFEKPIIERNQYLLYAGLIMVVAFFTIRASDLYGDPNNWQIQAAGIQATVFDFMNVSKYPPSLLFLLATIGPMTILCAYADRMPAKLYNILVLFGRVPFAFYIAHFCLLRLLSTILAYYQGFKIDEMMTFFFFLPQSYGVTLIWVYIIWLFVLIMLYPLCKWFANVKARRKDWWLSYL